MGDFATDVRPPSRRRLRKLDRQNPDREDFAEALVAEMFGGRVANDVTDWYDVVDDGTKIEVKSTEKRIGDDYPADGRFRLWADQHRSLLASDASGTAWYVFVLFDDGSLVDVRRCRPSTVTRLVEDVGDGEWDLSGHVDRDGAEQQKLPWSEVFNE